MAEIPFKASFVAEQARVVESLGDEHVPAVDDGKPKDELAELTSWVMTRVRQWRDHRRQNYELQWDEYERKWRGMWAVEDKARKSERSTLVTPALGEAVENIVSEVEEANWGRGDMFDMSAGIEDSPEMKEITDRNKTLLKEDLSASDFRPFMGEALINAAVYGTGIGEIFVQTLKMREISASIEAWVLGVQQGVPPELQVVTTERRAAVFQSVNPRNFVIDPIARTVDTALGVAVEEYVGAHIVRAGQKDGSYRRVEIGTSAGDTELGADRQVENEYVHDKVHVVRYYGLVPEHLLPADQQRSMEGEISDQDEFVDLMADLPAEDDQPSATSGKKAVDPIDADMVEAIVIIANDGIAIKAVRSPYVMEDRPVVAFPWDIVPGRFWGRGVCEKGLVPQKVMDAELRARIDALAYVSAPMMGMDASKLPRGFQFKVAPGKSILTNGKPADILHPFHFGNLDQTTFQHSQQLDQMIQRATGSLDVISLASRAGGDARPGAVSMMLSGIVKRHKRTLMNFIDRFYVPTLRKMMWRNMQFQPERYAPLNWTFNASTTMGILQREYETQQLVSLMQSMDPTSKEYKLLLMAVVENTGLTKRAQIVKMIQQSIDNAAAMEQAQTQQAVDPMQQQIMAAQAQVQLAEAQAKIRELNSRATLQDVKARNEMVEPQFRQLELATKGIYSLEDSLQDRALDRRLKLVDRAIDMEDIRSNERIAKIQSGQSVRSEALKSAGALASETVRSRAQVAAARADATGKAVGERVKAQGAVASERERAKAERTKAGAQAFSSFVGSQAKVTE
jgi:hypothetical protein